MPNIRLAGPPSGRYLKRLYVPVSLRFPNPKGWLFLPDLIGYLSVMPSLLGFIFLLHCFYGSEKNYDRILLAASCATFPVFWYAGLIVLRNAVVVSRRLSWAGRRTDQEWLLWLRQAHEAASIDQAPLLSCGCGAEACLSASLPKEARVQQYEFAELGYASEFSSRHRALIIQRLRASSADQHGEQRLAIGLLETRDGECLLLFRQIHDECAHFFTISHKRNGTVVNLITHRWALYNRDASPQRGRRRSDEEIAAKIGVPDKEKWRAMPEWGALGYWHLVDCICRKLGGDGETPGPETSDSDSELDYYEKVTHVETVKELQQTQPTPPAHRQNSKPQSVKTDSAGNTFL
jgi:hypothetical protein